MRKLPTLEPTSNCPDPNCNAPIGQEHAPDCEVATCLETGEQRILHQQDMPETPTGADAEFASLLTHNCGADTWTGVRYGVVECHEYGLFVRRPTADDPGGSTWVPCKEGHPGAVPDLGRLAEHATWSPNQRRWVRREAVPGRG